LSFANSEENLRVIAPVPQVVRLAKNARLLLSWSDNQVKIWKVEPVLGDDLISKRFLLEMTINVPPIHVCIESNHQGEENISAAAISPNGEYLLVATLSQSKLFALTESTPTVSVEQLGVFPHGARLATFTSAGDAIVLVTPDSEVQIHPFLDETAPTTRFPYTKPDYINKLAVSPDGDRFATSSSTSFVAVQSFNPDVSPEILPQPDAPITSLAFLTPDLIAITLADRNRLLLFMRGKNEWMLHPWSQTVDNMPIQIGITVDKCLGTFLVENDPSKIWLWGANWLAYIMPDAHPSLINSINEEESKQETPHWIVYRYRDVLLADVLTSSEDRVELVVVERPRHEILEDITEPRFYRHEYGT
jgi:hypothetical protein